MSASDERTLKVLIVDDNPADVHLIREALLEQKFPFDLKSIDDGEAAFQYFAETTGTRIADIILLDLNLPKVAGDAILGRIRENAAMKDVPIIVLTSSDSPKDRSRAEHLGATAYVLKPSNLDEFLAIGNLVRRLTLGES